MSLAALGPHNESSSPSFSISEIESRGGEMFATVKQRCASCDFPEVCELDLRRDPNHPIWETYCPNAATLIALTSPWWLTH